MTFKQTGRKAATSIVILALGSGAAAAQELCQGYGPQTPRDIASSHGTNKSIINFAPPSNEMNLCNIHVHTNAEHKGPGFSVFAGEEDHGGYQCNETSELSEDESREPEHSEDGMHELHAGDTVEVHWVFTTCEVEPGPGLGSCLSEKCANPELRVESQVFLAVNDSSALDFGDFITASARVGGMSQPKKLPSGTGSPVVFMGSTTGTSYTQTECSPMQVTWSVRPECAKMDVNTLHQWVETGNEFEEIHAHGVRQLVTAPELLSQIPGN